VTSSSQSQKAPLKSRSSSKTNGLKRAIIKTLNLAGFVAWNNNTTGIWDPVKKVFRKNWDPNSIGVGDVLASIKGQHVEFEIKTGKDVQSDRQQQHQKRIIKDGGMYFEIKDIDQFIAICRERKWIK
jgi:hypothetical protein